MPDYDFDHVTPNDSKALIEIGLESFSSKNEVKYSFKSGVLTISADVDGKTYSKTIDGLTEKHVDVVEIKKSSGSFKVVLKKKQKFNLEELFYNGE